MISSIDKSNVVVPEVAINILFTVVQFLGLYHFLTKL